MLRCLVYLYYTLCKIKYNRKKIRKIKIKKKIKKSPQSRIFTRFLGIKDGIKFLIIVKIVVFTRIRDGG